MRRLVGGVWMVSALAGAGGSEERVPTPTPVSVETPEPRVVPEAPSRLVVVTDWVDGQPYAEKWLIILSSETELGHEPASLAFIAEHPELSLEPVRLSSSQFKGLMPCCEVVVAKALDGRAEAAASRLDLTGTPVEIDAGAWLSPLGVERPEALGVGDALELYAWGEQTPREQCAVPSWQGWAISTETACPSRWSARFPRRSRSAAAMVWSAVLRGWPTATVPADRSAYAASGEV